MIVATLIGSLGAVAMYCVLRWLVASERHGTGCHLDFNDKYDRRLAILISIVIGVVAALLALAFV